MERLKNEDFFGNYYNKINELILKVKHNVVKNINVIDIFKGLNAKIENKKCFAINEMELEELINNLLNKIFKLIT